MERKTVRSGFAYDINGGGGSAESSERARRLKEELGSVPVTGIEDRVAYRFLKRAFDIVFSAAVLVVFCWLYAIIAILIKVDDPKAPVFFSQERVGKDGRTFRMLKFRSMCVDAEDRLAELRELNEKTGPVFKIAEDPRITRVGKWLRKLSLDELPQFINVLRSDMSIVGPRPALPAEVATYDDYQRQRLLVKPGLTCYWQTRRNRDSITFDEWVDLDLWREKVSMRSMRVDDSCPYCKNRKLLRGFNDLATTYPELVAEWDRDRNGDLRPDGIVSGSARRVWWRCGRGHAWQTSAYNRTGGADRGCPYCGDRKVLKGYNDLRTTHPEIAREWNKERNGDLKPTGVIASSNKRVWWKCKEGHEWSGLVASRARRGKADPGCPYCSGRKVLAGYNDLAAAHPGIAAMWHPRMNKRLKPTGVQAISRKPAWWRGECGHVCQMAVRDRVRAKPGYCQYCSGRKRPEGPIRLD